MTTTLLTGLPRSGTTLLCKFLDSQPNCVALAEPMARTSFHSPNEALSEIDRFVAAVRDRALTQGKVPTKQIDGRIVDNFVTNDARSNTLRKDVAKLRDVDVGKMLSPSFNLFIKHPALFTALVPYLSSRYPVFAMVRHPLAVLASWQTVEMAVNRGHAPAAERLTPLLAQRLEAEPEQLGRQMILLTWFFHTYRTLPRHRVVRFEDLASNPSMVLTQQFGVANPVVWQVQPESIAKRYPYVDLPTLAKVIRPSAHEFESHYPGLRADLDRLC